VVLGSFTELVGFFFLFAELGGGAVHLALKLLGGFFLDAEVLVGERLDLST